MRWAKVGLLVSTTAAGVQLCAAGWRPANGANVTDTLVDQNSSVRINLNGPASLANGAVGVNRWIVNGTSDLNLQWFCFRVGSGSQSSLDTLNLVGSPTPVSSNSDAQPNFLSTTYQTAPAAANPFTINITYNLTGGPIGSASSDLAEAITIQNTGTATLPFHFFEYSDFALGGATSPQTVAITGGHTATVTDPVLHIISTTGVTPLPSFFQAGAKSPSPTLLDELNTISNLQLDNNTTSSTPTNTTEWAFEWDVNLAPNDSLVISVDKNLRAVPEPATTTALLGLGWLFLIRPRRKR